MEKQINWLKLSMNFAVSKERSSNYRNTKYAILVTGTICIIGEEDDSF